LKIQRRDEWYLAAERQVDMTRWLILLCLLAVTLLPAPPAAAYMHPELGRFMQRDPLLADPRPGDVIEVDSEYRSSVAITLIGGLAAANSSAADCLSAYQAALQRIQDLANAYPTFPVEEEKRRALRQYEDCLGYLPNVSMCGRDPRVDGGTILPNHQYYSCDAATLAGYGWTATGGRLIGNDAPNTGETVTCRRCKLNGSPLKYGSTGGIGKPSTSASEAEIIDCIKNTPTAKSYCSLPIPWMYYTCRSWVSDAAAACGISCDGEETVRQF
jgi:hypothetical protein